MNRYTLKFSALLNHTPHKYSFYFLIAANNDEEVIELSKEYFHECEYSDKIKKLIKEFLHVAVVQPSDDALARVISYEVY